VADRAADDDGAGLRSKKTETGSRDLELILIGEDVEE